MAGTSLTHIRIATRKSTLALWQANYVRQQLLAYHPQLEISLVPLITSGDQIYPGAVQIGKSMFVKELQLALLANQADIAVHSLKDLSVSPTPGLCLAAVCQRDDPRDVLISTHQHTLTELPAGACIGTNSPRRQSQLRALRPDLTVLALRGNIDSRIARLIKSEFNAIVLAAAGLKRLALQQHISEYFDPLQFVPAIAQGVIGIECRSDASILHKLLTPLDHALTRICVTAERALNQRLGGDCYTPIGAYAKLQNEQLILHAVVGSLDGKHMIKGTKIGQLAKPGELGFALAEQLLSQGADTLL